MSDCEICPLLVDQYEGDANVLLQTEYWVVVLDTNQEYLGKSFVTLREHRQTISELSQVQWQDLHDVMRRLEVAIKQAFGADVLNWQCLMNNAIKAGQPTHVHWHLHPRYLNGVTFAGETFTDDRWPLRREKQFHVVDDVLFTKIADRIRSVL